MTDLFRRQSARLSEDWLQIFGQCWMIFRARCGEPSRLDACGQIEHARFQFLIFDFDFFFSRRCFIQACAREYRYSRGCTKNPLEGTGVTFAEIAEIFRTAFAVPQPAVFGTAPASSPLPAWFPRRARFDSRISHHDALASLLVAQRLLNPSCLLWFDFACADHASNAKRNFIIGIVRTEWSPPGHLPIIPMRTRRQRLIPHGLRARHDAVTL